MTRALVLLALLALATPAAAWPADDYGSPRFGAINRCMIEGARTNKQRNLKPDPAHLDLIICMDALGFEHCDDCQVFGEHGPKCRDDRDFGYFHSWCWQEIKHD